MRPVEVSVIVPAYNVAEYLHGALQRLASQKHDSFEVIVVDDASTDDTARIAHGFEADHTVMRYVAQPQNLGVAAARQRGVSEARGEYVWFVDADDEWTDDALTVLVGEARATGADTVVAAAFYVMPDGSEKPVASPVSSPSLSGRAAFRLFLLGSISGHLWNKLFRRELLEGIDFVRSRQHSDQAMVAQLLARSRRVSAIDSVVYRYRLRHGSIIRSGSRRADSLALVSEAVLACASAIDPDLPTSREYQYYRARFELLSRLKDATSDSYSAEDSDRLVEEVRRAISFSALIALARARDAKRFGLLAAAKASPSMYRLIMRREGART